MQEITLGNAMQDSYEVLSGLVNGAEVVTNGAFSVDAAAQLEGKPSMMNRGGAASGAMPGMDHPAVKTNVAHDHGGTNAVKETVNSDFVKQLTAVYEQYIVLKNGLVQSDPKTAGESAVSLKKALSAVNMKLLSGDSHEQWMNVLNSMNKQVASISRSGNLEEQRRAFSEMSHSFYSAIKKFGLINKIVYYQFCPMALNNKGAYWMSEIKDIRNPYFGQAMLTCGETKETMNF